MRLSRRIGKRLLAQPTIGRIVSAIATRQIAAYERRLPRLWNVYSKIPETNRIATSDADEQSRLLESHYSFLAAHTATLDLRPLISVVIPVYKPEVEFLRQALQSVALQAYPNWQACIVDDGSQSPRITQVLEEFRGQHPGRTQVLTLDRNRGIARASNAALDMATGDYVALLDHDDRLYLDALAEVVRAINLEVAMGQPAPQILYSDERLVGEHGQQIGDPFFKPDWSPLLHLSVNYTTHLSIYDRGLLQSIGGFREGFDGSQDHDLMLRASEAARSRVVHIPASLYQWRAHRGSTAASLSAKPQAADAGVRAVSEACERRGTPAKVRFEPDTGHYRVDFLVPDPPPLVSIIIPTRDRADLLKQCLDSIRKRTTYPNYEIILVDNGTTEPAATDLLAEESGKDDLRVVHEDGYFNFGRLCNRGAREARGDYLVLLNNDTVVLSRDWLEALVGVAAIPTTGAVGAKLLYPSGHVQHAGVVGIGDQVAGHAGRGRDQDDPMYFHILDTMHEVIAVTGACMCVRTAVYRSVGGLDEKWVPNAYGDVDFCLRLRADGYTNVFTPYALLEHKESPSRRRNVERFERAYMRSRWSSELLNDPYVNPQLLRGEHFQTDHRFESPEVPATLFDQLLE